MPPKGLLPSMASLYDRPHMGQAGPVAGLRSG
jgi:hypothetical protein